MIRRIDKALQDRLAIRRLFWRGFRTSLEEARMQWNATEASKQKRRPFGTVREFVKHFGDSHAKQLDDVRIGCRSLSRAPLSKAAFDLFFKKIIKPYCRDAASERINSLFLEVYSKDAEFSKRLDRIRADQNGLVRSLLNGYTIEEITANNYVFIEWIIRHIRKAPFGSSKTDNISSAIALMLHLDGDEAIPNRKRGNEVIRILTAFVAIEAFEQRNWTAFEYISHHLDAAPGPSQLDSIFDLIVFLDDVSRFDWADDGENIAGNSELASAVLDTLAKNEKIRSDVPAEISLYVVCGMFRLIRDGLHDARFVKPTGDPECQALVQRFVKCFNSRELYHEWFAHTYGSAAWTALSEGVRMRYWCLWCEIKSHGSRDDLKDAVLALERAWKEASPSVTTNVRSCHEFYLVASRLLIFCGYHDWAVIAMDKLAKLMQGREDPKIVARIIEIGNELLDDAEPDDEEEIRLEDALGLIKILRVKN